MRLRSSGWRHIKAETLQLIGNLVLGRGDACSQHQDNYRNVAKASNAHARHVFIREVQSVESAKNHILTVR